MVMERKKKFNLVMTIFVLFFGGIAISAGVVYWMTKPEVIREDGLTEEQYQFLTSSILRGVFEELGAVERRNAWLILDAMREVGFIEPTQPGQSRAGSASWILGMLGIGEIQELTVVEHHPCNSYENLNVNGFLILRIVSEENNIYYADFGQTWGLDMVFEESWNGILIFSRIFHRIIDGQICEIWYPYTCR